MWIMNICIYCLSLDRSVIYLDHEVCALALAREHFHCFPPCCGCWWCFALRIECVRVCASGDVCLCSVFISLSVKHSFSSLSISQQACNETHKVDVLFVPSNQINQTASPCTLWLHIIFWKEQIWKPIWFRMYWLHFYSLPIFNEKRNHGCR